MKEALKEIIKDFGNGNNRFFVKYRKKGGISTGTVIFKEADGTRKEVDFMVFDD